MSRWRRRYDRHNARSGSGTGKLLAIAFTLALLGIFAHSRGWISLSPTTISGRATVLDGDTLSIEGTHIRLEGIDAPEAEQTCTDAKGESWSCGKRAASELRAYIHGQRVTCKAMEVDKYDRVVGICTLPDSSDINAWMVRQGWAISYGYSGHYEPEQAAAEGEKRGLWVGTFTRPAQWRKTAPD